MQHHARYNLTLLPRNAARTWVHAAFALLSILLALALASAALAQAPVGTISGVVLDPSDAVIPNAAVIIKNKATGAQRKMESSSDGAFSAPALLPAAASIAVPKTRRSHGRSSAL